MLRRVWIAWMGIGLAFSAGAAAQSEPDFDECGVLVQADGCVLFEGGGGSYYLSDYQNHQAGDAVRVVGYLSEDCVTICQAADGCIAGAVLYDPAVFPCGTDLQVDFDPCTPITTALLGALAAGFLFVGRKRHETSPAPQARA